VAGLVTRPDSSRGRVEPHPTGSPSPSASGTAPADPRSGLVDAGLDGGGGTGLKLSIRRTGNDSVALTFDDGPGAQTMQILALLAQYHVTATFCLIGVNVRAHHDLVQAIVRDGHTLCNHTWKHDLHLGDKTPEQIRADLQATNDEIHAAVPDAPIKYFRHPGGNFTPAAVQVAKELGMASIGWEVDPSDWDVRRYAPGSTMTNHVIANLRHNVKAGSIVLSHDGGGDRTSTVTAYRTVLPELVQRFTLAALPASEPPPSG
jgi:peptidoglycan/xylan/chitin deacetylase (PgdA/CDA1 family)